MRASRRFMASLFTLFGALGLGLAAFGVYGVVAHSVAERRRELGVRIALGAARSDVLHAVLRESVLIALVGTAAGLFVTKYSVMLVGQFTAENDVYNAPLFAGVAVFLAAMAAAAAMVPAWKATRVDPTECLRCE
jgi:ABC-type antimicrobial peptide transport system permease subunit